MNRFLTSTCCFIGNEDIPRCDEEKIITRVRYIVEPLINRGIRYFGVGGNAGFDIITAEYLIVQRDYYRKDIKVISVLPYPGWYRDWDSQKILRKEKILELSDKVTYVQSGYSGDATRIVHRKLIDGSSFCVAYCNQNTGEVADSVRYAIGKGLQVYNASSWDLEQL